MRMTVCVASMVLATAIVASAQTPPAAPAAGTACSLFTKDDAAAAVGEAVNAPKSTVMPEGPSNCSYAGSGIHGVIVNVMPLTAETAGMYKAMCAQKRKEELTGLGDVTCWYDDRHAELQVLKGLTFFAIELSRSGDPTEAITDAARKVYARAK